MADPTEAPRPTLEQLTEMERTARLAARRYARDPAAAAELEQAAWLELLKAQRTFAPDLEVPFGAYCWRVAMRAVRAAAFAGRAPVSGGKHRPETVRRCRGVPAAQEGEDGALREHPAVAATNAVPRPDAALAEADFCQRVRARVAELVGEAGAPFAFAVITGEHAPAEIAAHHDVPVAKVYRLAKRARALLGDDAGLFELWKERLG